MRALTIGATVLVAAAVSTTLVRDGSHASTDASDPVTTGSPMVFETPPAGSQPLRWLAAAAGGLPEFNQVSIEQDLALAAEVFGPGGRILFGAGVGSPTVQILGVNPTPDPLMAVLGDLFQPRGGRDAQYRATTLATAEPATATSVLEGIDDAVTSGHGPVLLYLAGHGNMGEIPRNNTISFWAQSDVTVGEFAEVLDRARRPVRLVVTTCFSGGLAELAFAAADPAQGSARVERCGLFAATWDLEASGCDPNPDRAAQQGYGIHFLNALRGLDRDGQALALEAVDFDGDGEISLLEAHTRVRVASAAADVPTTTAERWLRQVVGPQARGVGRQGEGASVSLPEEDAVVAALSERLGLVGGAGQALLELQRLGDDLEVAMRRMQDAQATEDRAYRAAAAELLSRWPVLDDPWHPDFATLLAEQGATILRHLEVSERYAAYVRAREQVDRLGNGVWQIRLQAAPVERLVRALDNRELASQLYARGGEDWAVYERLLACERSTL